MFVMMSNWYSMRCFNLVPIVFCSYLHHQIVLVPSICYRNPQLLELKIIDHVSILKVRCYSKAQDIIRGK